MTAEQQKSNIPSPSRSPEQPTAPCRIADSHWST